MQTNMKNTIGVVSGLGPSAGLDLAQKVLNETLACRDQEHVPLVLVSIPELIGNRTGFILGQSAVNPADGIVQAIGKLQAAGAGIIGIPCNTSHAQSIFSRVQDYAARQHGAIKLLNMVTEVCEHIRTCHPQVRRVGVLSTTGTAISGLYGDALRTISTQIIDLTPELQHELNEAIHNERFGIKAQSNPITERAVEILQSCIEYLALSKAELIVLACTELPLAINRLNFGRLPFVDSTLILARALLREAAPEKLKPWPGGSESASGPVSVREEARIGEPVL
jgi:aspartate racemase